MGWQLTTKTMKNGPLLGEKDESSFPGLILFPQSSFPPSIVNKSLKCKVQPGHSFCILRPKERLLGKKNSWLMQTKTPHNIIAVTVILWLMTQNEISRPTLDFTVWSTDST